MLVLLALFVMLKGIFEYTKQFSCLAWRVIRFYWNCQNVVIRLPIVEVICIVLTACSTQPTPSLHVGDPRGLVSHGKQHWLAGIIRVKTQPIYYKFIVSYPYLF